MIFFTRMLLFFGIFYFACSPVNVKKPPKVIKGVLDFQESNWEFAKDGVIKLDGDWEFYWKEFLEPKDSRLQPTVLDQRIQNYIRVPGPWNGFISSDGKPVGGDGYGTYRLLIKNPPKDLTHIKLLFISTAHSLFINGIPVSGTGTVGFDPANSIPFNRPIILKLPQIKEKEIEILFHVSNFFHARGGLDSPISIGTEKALQEIRFRSQALDLFLFGSLLIMSLYHFGLYFLRRSDTSSLYFAIFSFLFAIRPLFISENLIISFFPNLSWELSLIINYLTLCAAPAFLLLFLDLVFSEEFKRKVTYFLCFAFLFLSLLVLFFPAKIFTSVLNVVQGFIMISCLYCLYFLIKAAWKNRKGAKIFLFVLLLIIVIVVNDILYQKGIVSTGYYGTFGIFIFVFGQAYLLADRFSGAYAESIRSRNFAEEQRMIAANAKLEVEKLSKTKDEFLANLSHEIKTPLSVVFAYSEMLVGGSVNPEKVVKYSKSIHDSAQKLNNYVGDLILITDIESNLQLQKSKINLKNLIVEAIEELKPILEEKKIELEERLTENLEWDCDPILLKKAISIVLKNAAVYNKQSGKITVETIKGTPQLQIKVSDTGIGIAEEFHEKIFEKFFRVDSALTYEVSGVGVGLFIAKKIMELHGGSMEVKSELKNGSEFVLNL